MKLAINIALSLAMLALCLWWVWPNAAESARIEQEFERLVFADFWPYLAGYLVLLATTHFFRAWRWNNLLDPIGARLPPGKLLAISSVSFMAILAFPARLGELVRPALIRKKGEVSARAVLGTVAIERIGDGLMVSLFVFGALFARRGPGAPSWMMPTAYGALGVFAAAMVFLAFAYRRPERTVRFCVALTLLPRFAPAIARKIERTLLKMISGLSVLQDHRNLALFIVWSLLYWVANGMSMWVLAHGFGLDLSIVGAFATMGVVAVGISLPNTPGLVGQYQLLVVGGLSLYGFSKEAVLPYAIVLHALQVVWYMGVGALCLATPHASLSDVFSGVRSSDNDDETTPIPNEEAT